MIDTNVILGAGGEGDIEINRKRRPSGAGACDKIVVASSKISEGVNGKAPVGRSQRRVLPRSKIKSISCSGRRRKLVKHIRAVAEPNQTRQIRLVDAVVA